MPQAMPLNWLELFLMFSLIFLLINIKMYYTNLMKFDNKKMIFNKNNQWKW
uniref:ATP synthase F0 subunit 8 n=1 Tax=Oenopia sauzeti TaxID=420097 RepID=A0A8E5JTV4_9CUCU|nr:ATP synthase F0 subunit 8 [Oenopia sauzeti]QVD39752.1 ATP synthase F0 subunit 8 [Oenopia sauzeti]